MKKIFILLLLLASVVYSIDCVGTVRMGLPAVTEGEVVDGGDLVVVELRLVPGEGEAYVAAIPPTDSSLQESISQAVIVAENLYGEPNQCDVLLEIEDPTDYVQGPSGGAAFTIMTYSLFSGEEMRDDATITGAIHEGGDVLPVGGLYEKILSAKSAGKTYFVTPRQTVDEQLMLSEIKGITIYQVENIQEAIDFFFYDVAPSPKPLNLTVEPLPILEVYPANTPRFEEVAKNIISREGSAVATLPDAELKEYFGERILQQNQLIEDGYYYSAANDAFLSYILADSLSNIDEPDVPAKKQEVEECMDGVVRVSPTYENYEWVMGAEARIKRAENQLETYGDLGAGTTKEERYFLIYQLDYSLAWCEAAKDMYTVAGELGGQKIDESVLQDTADLLINISSNYSEIEYSENYVNGIEMYEEGLYPGAIYELTYALAFEKKNQDAYEGISLMQIEELTNGTRESLWGDIFKAHAVYLIEAGDLESAYAVALFSRAMNELWLETQETRYLVNPFEFPEPGGEYAGAGNATEGESIVKCECPECPEQVCAVAFLLLILPFFIKNLPKK